MIKQHLKGKSAKDFLQIFKNNNLNIRIYISSLFGMDLSLLIFENIYNFKYKAIVGLCHWEA